MAGGAEPRLVNGYGELRRTTGRSRAVVEVCTHLAAADAARAADSRPERGRFVHIDRLGLVRFLLGWTQASTSEPVAPTLGASLDAGTWLVGTAAVLGVRRDIVAARVARVGSVLQVDLGDPDRPLMLPPDLPGADRPRASGI